MLSTKETRVKWLMCLLTYQSRYWPPGSLSIASTCYRVLVPLRISHQPTTPTLNLSSLWTSFPSPNWSFLCSTAFWAPHYVVPLLILLLLLVLPTLFFSSLALHTALPTPGPAHSPIWGLLVMFNLPLSRCALDSFRRPLAFLSLISTIKPSPQPSLGVVMSSFSFTTLYQTKASKSTDFSRGWRWDLMYQKGICCMVRYVLAC